jgi:hypothetical protein
MRAAIAISIAFHGALFTWLELQPEPAAPVTRPAPAVTIEVVAPAPEPEPMTVALLDDHSVATVAPTKSAPGKRPNKALAVSVSPPVATLVGPPTESTAPQTQLPTHSSLMVMRPPKIEHGSSGSVITKLAGVPQWGHELSGVEIDAERQADVDRRDAIANAELKPDGQGMKSEHQTFKIKVAPDGTVAIRDKKNWQQKSLFHAEFDVTDWAMRSHGIDPYAAYKKKVLDETREQRFEMGKQYRTQQLAMSGRYMQKNLERLLASTTTKAELKQGLFELWDECAESGSDELVAGGAAARAQLIGYIKTRLPAGSPDAYTAEELARMNKQRKSRLEFEPYDG